MSKQCVVCGQELTLPIQEFGPVNVPLCHPCFSDWNEEIEILINDYVDYFDILTVIKYCEKWEFDLSDLLGELAHEEIDIDWVLEDGAR